mmetsp:Transcript_18523/g.53408  ORF Transcript_18523/g.53408 Transcript_18523/m.53408 type:complete len:219 (+) Transcript_18523:811-1467(+)
MGHSLCGALIISSRCCTMSSATALCDHLSTTSRLACLPFSRPSSGLSRKCTNSRLSSFSSGSAHLCPGKASRPASTRPLIGRRKPFPSVTNSVGPDQFVAITGRPMAWASMYGRPHPSPRLGSTKASTVRYNRRSALAGIPERSIMPAPLRPSSGERPVAATHCSSRSESTSSGESWYKEVTIIRHEPVLGGGNAPQKERSNISYPFRFSHLKTERNR